MIYRMEVEHKNEARDPVGESAAAGIIDAFHIDVKDVRTRKVYTIDADIAPEEAEKTRAELTDPVIEISSLEPLATERFDWIIVVGYRPGVTDNFGRSFHTAIEDIIGRRLSDGDAVYTSTEYIIDAPGMSRQDAERIGKELLANELIETIRVLDFDEWKSGEYREYLPVVRNEPDLEVKNYNLASADDDELVRISKEGILALTLAEMRAIRDYFTSPENASKRKDLGLPANPTDVELEMLAQTWSEHCKHKIFNGVIEYVDEETGESEEIDSLFKSYIKRATQEVGRRVDWLVSVFDDNAGVIRFNDRLNLVYKVETHNSPSALDPYGGAMTGIVGVNRDPFGTGLGSELLINAWGYCFASPFFEGEPPKGLMRPRRIRDGVHKGVIDGGNQSGIPYGLGWELFDERYIGKPLVYCGTVGLMPREINGEPAHIKRLKPGDLIVMTGGRIGKDGIHGATFSSEELHSESPVSAVQIGDPITQKKMTDFLLEARDLGLYSCITDNGAGGLASSVGETARLSNGCEIELANAPLKYTGLQPWEILLSEAQERMTLGVPPDKIGRFMELARRREVEATVLGEYTDSGMFQAKYDGETVALIDMDFLHEGAPKMRMKAVWPKPDENDPRFDQPSDANAALNAMLRRLNICSGEKKARQYDHEVKGLNVFKQYQGINSDVPADAGVFLVEHGSWEGVILARGVNPHYSDIDTYHMMANVIDEAVRRTISVGGKLGHIAGLDNFCWPDPIQSESTPDGHYKLAQLVRANKALLDYCNAYDVPCISGKDSMKNDSTRGGVKISIPPTVLFSTIARMDDIRKAVSLDAKFPGDAVYVVGMTEKEIGGSEYLAHVGEIADGKRITGASVPRIDPQSTKKIYKKLSNAIEAGLVNSAHTPTKGGLGVALAKVAFAGELGMEIDLRKVPANYCDRDDYLLFSESGGRFVVTVSPDSREKFEAAMGGSPVSRIGRVTDDGRLRATGVNGDLIIDSDVLALKKAWQETMSQI